MQEPAQTEVAPHYVINKPTNISLEDIECTRVDKEPIKTVHHKPHRYPTRQETWIQKVYEEIGGKNLDKKHLMEIMSEDVRPKTRHEHLTHMDNAINSAQDTQEWLTPLVNAVINDEMGEALDYRQIIKQEKHRDVWVKSFENDPGRLAQDVYYRVKGAETIFFILYNNIPIDRRKDWTYGHIVCNFRPQKDEHHQTQLMVGGNLI